MEAVALAAGADTSAYPQQKCRRRSWLTASRDVGRRVWGADGRKRYIKRREGRHPVRPRRLRHERADLIPRLPASAYRAPCKAITCRHLQAAFRMGLGMGADFSGFIHRLLGRRHRRETAGGDVVLALFLARRAASCF